jgi:hypothetical protein
MRTSKISPENASLLGILIGRQSRSLYFSISRFGQRIRISLVATSTWTTDRVECICVHLELVASRLLYPPPTLESSGPAWRSLRCHLIAIGTCFSNRAHRVNLGRRGFVGRKLHRLRSASLFYRRHGLGPSIDTILTGTRSRWCLILIGSLLYHFRLYRITTQ